MSGKSMIAIMALRGERQERCESYVIRTNLDPTFIAKPHAVKIDSKHGATEKFGIVQRTGREAK